MSDDPMRADSYIRQARQLRDWAEREWMPASTIRPLELSPVDRGIQVEWWFDGRSVVVMITERTRFLECRKDGAWYGPVDLRRDGVGTFRRAVAWMLGEPDSPPTSL